MVISLQITFLSEVHCSVDDLALGGRCLDLGLPDGTSAEAKIDMCIQTSVICRHYLGTDGALLTTLSER